MLPGTQAAPPTLMGKSSSIKVPPCKLSSAGDTMTANPMLPYNLDMQHQAALPHHQCPLESLCVCSILLCSVHSPPNLMLASLPDLSPSDANCRTTHPPRPIPAHVLVCCLLAVSLFIFPLLVGEPASFSLSPHRSNSRDVIGSCYS